MNTYNNSLRFYKSYYKDVNWSANNKDSANKTHFESQNKRITQGQLLDSNGRLPLPNYNCQEEDAIELVTMYPGLLIGSGITHGSGREGEIKIGFYFDHTTGLPVIPGSSVKGTLRSVFPLDYLKNAKKAEKEEKTLLKEKSEAVTEYLIDELKGIVEGSEWDKNDIHQLERWLFGDNEAGTDNQFSISERVIFYDALPVRMLKADLKANLPFLGMDYITPHSDPLKDPVPIQFLKVMPGLVYRFQFRWATYKSPDRDLHLEPEHLKALFTTILEDIGIGAKTNVGYGQLMDLDAYKNQYWTEAERKRWQRVQENKEQEEKDKIIEEKRNLKKKKKAKLLNELPDEYFLTEMPEPGATLKNVYARVLPLNDAERKREEKKKKRKRIEIIAAPGLKLGRKWNSEFWELPKNTIISATIEFRDAVNENDGTLHINQIIDFKVENRETASEKE